MLSGEKTGSTMIEVLMTIAVAATIAAAAGITYMRAYRITALKNAAEEIVTGIRFAQQRSMSQEQGLGWGININNTDASNPYFDVFSGTYAPANIAYHYALPNVLGFQSPGSGFNVEINFAKVTGIPSTSTVIILINRGSPKTKTVTINAFGGVSTD